MMNVDFRNRNFVQISLLNINLAIQDSYLNKKKAMPFSIVFNKVVNVIYIKDVYEYNFVSASSGQLNK